MKNRQKRDGFDMIMANLKPLEPSAELDAQFKSRLEEAVAKRYAQKPLEALITRIGYVFEDLKNALIVRPSVLARVAATFLFFLSAGLYIYSIQPVSPFAMNVEGEVLLQSSGDTQAKAITPATILKQGDTVTTQDNSQFDINLMNRYTVRVKPNTSFKIAKLSPRLGKGSVRLDMQSGKMLLNVEKGFEGSKFTVDTSAGSATAFGTMFGVFMPEADKSKMDVGVLEGAVRVASSYKPTAALEARETVVVESGQMTEVISGELPETPRRLDERFWRELEELYQIGSKPRIVLMIKNTPNRVMQLLAPAPIYISDDSMLALPSDIELAIEKISEGVRSNDQSKYYQAIKIMENMISRHPQSKNNAQLLLYIGSLYDYIGKYEDAIKAFNRVIAMYPKSQYASMAQCAIGVVYEEKLSDQNRAEEAYKTVLEKYPYSLEAIWVEDRLGIKKPR